MKVYTRTGDGGQTSLVGGQRVSKCCIRLESYGMTDELNSHIGLLISQCKNTGDRAFLTQIQHNLFVLGGYLATDTTTTAVRPGNQMTEDMVTILEQEIDRIQTELPPLQLFLLPGGCMEASQAHVCRTVCRRTERQMLRLRESGAEVGTVELTYVNRLSDYLFILARKLNFDAGITEETWKRKKK